MTRRSSLPSFTRFGIASLGIAASAVLLSACTLPRDVSASNRPNILLIVADDMGYSDLGCFGGEIRTPNLDALAARGMRGTNFCVGPTCSPTRSMLLSGVDNHIAGLGNMHEYTGPQQAGKPGYEGHLNDRVASFPMLLRDSGYHTYMAGKWHLGEEEPNWPHAKGFEHDFTLMQGGGSNWSDMLYPNPQHPNLTFSLDGKRLDKLPDDHFSTAAYADYIMKCMDGDSDDKPFFAYLSFQAVHSPFAVPDDWLDRYKGMYDAGYDALRDSRLARMKEMGLVGKDVKAFPRLPSVPAWDSLTPEQKRVSSRKMELYAAMLENMDHHIGRVLEHIKAKGQLDNTIVMFMSDNGAEFTEAMALIESLGPGPKKWAEENFDTRPENWGRKGSLVDYGEAWAQVGAVPFRMFKHYVAEGGIRSPLILAGPGIQHSGAVSNALIHAKDVAPTFLEAANVMHPGTLPGAKIVAPQGKSLLPLLAGNKQSVRSDTDWIGWEMFGNRAIRQGDWKILYITKEARGSGQWELFNLREDPSEMIDLSGKEPERMKAMLALWDQYVKENGVILTGDGPFQARRGGSPGAADKH